MTTTLTPHGARPSLSWIDDLENRALLFDRRVWHVYARSAHAAGCDGERDPKSLYAFDLRACTVAAEDHFRFLEKESTSRTFVVQEYVAYVAAVAAVRQHPLWEEDGLDDPRVSLDLWDISSIYLFESDRAGCLFIVTAQPHPHLEQARVAPVQTVPWPRLSWSPQKGRFARRWGPEQED